MLIYKNLLRSLDNFGINAAFTLKYYYKGHLTEYEKLAFLRTQVTSQEYLQQVTNFSPFLRKKIQMFQDGELYKKLLDM